MAKSASQLLESADCRYSSTSLQMGNGRLARCRATGQFVLTKTSQDSQPTHLTADISRQHHTMGGTKGASVHRVVQSR